jgi:hypothetical protein
MYIPDVLYVLLCKYYYIFTNQPTKILMYSYTISKKERYIGSSFASACNDSNL